MNSTKLKEIIKFSFNKNLQNKWFILFNIITLISVIFMLNWGNFSNLIPSDFSIIVNTKLNSFYSAIDRAALLTQSKDKNIVKMRIKNNKMIINYFNS